jgi:hypothetical protein
VKYRKKPVVIEATQWMRHGDHPIVETISPDSLNGWIQTLEGGHIVSPGDYIITGVKGEHYPCKPDIFTMTYEPVEGGQAVSNTPISDSTPHNVADLGMLCRRIERELTAANSIIRQQQLLDEENLRLQDHIKRLESKLVQIDKWYKAKEDKP